MDVVSGWAVDVTGCLRAFQASIVLKRFPPWYNRFYVSVHRPAPYGPASANTDPGSHLDCLLWTSSCSHSNGFHLRFPTEILFVDGHFPTSTVTQPSPPTHSNHSSIFSISRIPLLSIAEEYPGKAFWQ